MSLISRQLQTPCAGPCTQHQLNHKPPSAAFTQASWLRGEASVTFRVALEAGQRSANGFSAVQAGSVHRVRKARR